MLRLRPYRKSDAEYIVTWIKDEVTFRKWSADRFDSYQMCIRDSPSSIWVFLSMSARNAE